MAEGAERESSGGALGRCVIGIVEKVRFPKSCDGGALVHSFKI